MTGRPKPGLTFERHVEIGKRLLEIRLELMDLLIETSGAYPRTSAFARKLKQALDRVDAARSAGDSACCDDEPRKFCTHVYYGHDLYYPRNDFDRRWSGSTELPHQCGTSYREPVRT
ncbi:hypothetical protein [Kribbella soli]|uniref:Uncharacterized protein n=1 Tax=Kribbella soli TaxID=1124743 RepID=A0A4V2LXU1_9ACTN|nr:hypothetical protein [Kribbella soli]TCC01336.1 hypothetical protein E0H45_42205 [Kribbella soli]